MWLNRTCFKVKVGVGWLRAGVGQATNASLDEVFDGESLLDAVKSCGRAKVRRRKRGNEMVDKMFESPRLDEGVTTVGRRLLWWCWEE